MVKYIPCSKLIFHVDNGLGVNLKGTGLAAEYDIFHRKIIWRKLSQGRLRHQEQLSARFLLMSSLLPSSLFVTITFFLRILPGDVRTIGSWGIYVYVVPILLGIIMFVSFEYLMIRIRNQYELCEAPSDSEQLSYFEGIEQTSLRFNDVWSSNRVPYLANIIVITLILGVVLPLMFLLYINSERLGESVIKLIILGLLISLVPNVIWNVIIKSIVLSRLKTDVKEKLNER